VVVHVRVKPNAKIASIEAAGETLVITVREPARDNRANDAVRLVLAKHFLVPPSRVRLVRGATARIKAFEIDV
jgi:uncharacterized protein YggU (UPF0235/DUF167 family)